MNNIYQSNYDYYINGGTCYTFLYFRKQVRISKVVIFKDKNMNVYERKRKRSENMDIESRKDETK